MKTDNLVHARVIDAINDGEDLAAFFNDLLRNWRTGSNLIGPAVYMLAHCFVVARDGGFAVGQPDTSVSSFLSASQTRMLFDLNLSLNSNPVLAGEQLSGLVAAINFARNSGCTWSIPDQPQKAPIAVSIVSMVERVTKTELERDSKGLITASKQTESDAAQCYS